MSSSWAYACACLAVPALWGLVMYYAFGYWDRRRRARTPTPAEPPPIEYHI